MKKKALFIVNPVSGGKAKDDVPQLIQKYLDTTIFDASIIYTDGANHAKQLAAEAVRNRVDLVVAVGGDGTVNEAASSLVGSQTAFGILPFGSGNGLSRFLKVPMNVCKAISNLNALRIEVIDSATANGAPFFNLAGMGFDAHIAEVFSHNKTRGFITYAKSALTEIVNYKPQSYHINIDGADYERTAFMLSFANSSQFGNNAHVSPKASVQDGLIDVCIIKKFPLWRFPEMAIRMFTKTADGSKYVEIIRGKHIVITPEKPGPMHLDGEPHQLDAKVEINVVPHSLKIITGKDYKAR